MDTGGSRMHKHKRTAELDTEEPELGTVEVWAALEQADRWVGQWDRQGCSSGQCDPEMVG